MDIKKETIELHEKLKGKLTLKPKIEVNRKILSLLYTPGVAEIVKLIYENKNNVYSYTGKGNSIAIVSDGSRILGLGNKGPLAALPVMESKAFLFKYYGDVDAVPICIKTQDKDEIVKLVEDISPNFGAINIEDIEAPKCFFIVDELSKKLDIPVFHDDHHGTAIVTVAALLNSFKLVNKDIINSKIVILGAGAAGYGITKLLLKAGAKNVIVLDSKGIIHKGRENLTLSKIEIAQSTNFKGIKGSLKEAINGSDVFIGVSAQPNILTVEMIKEMNKDPIIFALTNPNPEIMPDEAVKAGAKIVATGRSDFPNQVNNVIVFPFLMRKILDEKIKKVDFEFMFEIAKKLSDMTKNLDFNHILPNVEEVRKF